MVIYKNNYNTQMFDLNNDGIARGMAFVKNLLEDSKKDSKSYNDIHTYIEENLLVVSWVQVPYDSSCENGSFQFVDSDEVVVKEIFFPDNHFEYVASPEEEEEVVEQWHKDNPQWVKTPYGGWTNEEENRMAAEELKRLIKEDEDDVEDGV